MKVEFINVPYSDLPSGLSGSCGCFNSTKEIQDILSTHSYGFSGICIITLNTGLVNVYKFAFSCIGDDGTVDIISKQFELDKKIVRSCIVEYALDMIKKGKK